MNRLGLFLFFDSEGIVDDYVRYLLDDMSENLSELCILVNGELTEEGRKIFEGYSDKIIIRSNKGFDVGAWKDAMIDEYGFEKLGEFDEVILFNDSFFGPVYPFREMFDEMEKKDLDFWAITVHGDAPDPRNLCPYPFRPRYLQLYFLVFTKNFINSKEFQDYWQEMPYYENFNDVGYKHQAVFTKHFSDLGFKWAAYVDTGDLEETVEKSISFHTYNMYEMVKNRRLPVIKRKAFKLPLKFHMIFNSGMDLSRTMKYLKQETDYDVSLIYKYFLRTMGPCELATVLNLKEIIPKVNVNSDYRSDKRIAVILQFSQEDSLQSVGSYLKNIPEYIDIIVFTDSQDKKQLMETECLSKLDNEYQVIIDKVLNMSTLIMNCNDLLGGYDYFAVVNDKEPDIDDYITIRNSATDSRWENMLASPDYINSIIMQLDDDDNLGLIVTPIPHYGTYYSQYSEKYWDNSFDNVQSLFNQMKLHTQISRDEYPLSMGNCFWVKTAALKPLFDLNINPDDNMDHTLERIYPYVAASQRYYTKTVMTEEYGQNELTNYSYMLNESVNVVKKKSNLVNFKRTFNVYLSTLRKGLVNKNQRKQIRKAKSMEASSSWKITKPLRKLSSFVKKFIK